MAIDHTEYLLRAHASSLADLVVSDVRRDWILRTYPFDDVGRPGILCSEPSPLPPLFKKDPVLARVVEEQGDSDINEDEYSELQIVTEEDLQGDSDIVSEDTQDESQDDSDNPEEDQTEAEVLEVFDEEDEHDLAVGVVSEDSDDNDR